MIDEKNKNEQSYISLKKVTTKLNNFLLFSLKDYFNIFFDKNKNKLQKLLKRCSSIFCIIYLNCAEIGLQLLIECFFIVTHVQIIYVKPHDVD